MLQFLGAGSAFNTEKGNTSAFIKKNGILFLIDCGSTCFSKLKNENMLDGVKNIYILVTHMHPDHVGSLGDLIFYSYHIMGKKAAVIMPGNDYVSILLKLMGVTSKIYNLIEFDKEYTVKQDEFSIVIRSIEVSHVKDLKCYGYILEENGHRVYYSGDSHNIPEKILKDFYKGAIETIYQDTTWLDYPENPHMSFRKLCDVIKPEYRSRVYCMHLEEDFDVQSAKKHGFNIAYELM
ncbi:MAG: MBL fold metallo-hydrolase [Caulobacteraceae bacterium]